MTLYPQTTTFYPATISGPFVEGRVRDKKDGVKGWMLASQVWFSFPPFLFKPHVRMIEAGSVVRVVVLVWTCSVVGCFASEP